MNASILKFTRAMAIGTLLVSVHVSKTYAADEPPEPTGVTMSDHFKAAAGAVKRNAKVVGAAVKEGAQKVGVEAKKTAHVVADATSKGAHAIDTAAKGVAEKSKAAVKTDKADHSAIERSGLSPHPRTP